MRMPFLQAMPISMMQPIWLKMLMVELNRHRAEQRARDARAAR